MKIKIFKNKHILLLFCCSNLLFVSKKSISQDFHLAQFDAFSQYLNPAMTGMFNGDYRANLQYRDQWSSILSKAYVTNVIGFDTQAPKSVPQLKNFKFGGYGIYEAAGTSNLNYLYVQLSCAYDMAIKKSNNHIAAGLQGGIFRNGVNQSNLTFGDQYTTQNGGGFNPSINSGENLSSTSILKPDFNLGVLYYYSNTQSIINPFLGGAVFHLTEPTESFLGNNNQLPRRYVVNGGLKINFSPKQQLNVTCFAEQETNVGEISISLSGMYHINPNVCLLYGVVLRNNQNLDADVIMVGMKYGEFTGRVSYDVNVSALNTYTNGRGAFEMSLVYVHKKAIVKPKPICPRI